MKWGLKDHNRNSVEKVSSVNKLFTLDADTDQDSDIFHWIIHLLKSLNKNKQLNSISANFFFRFSSFSNLHSSGWTVVQTANVNLSSVYWGRQTLCQHFGQYVYFTFCPGYKKFESNVFNEQKVYKISVRYIRFLEKDTMQDVWKGEMANGGKVRRSRFSLLCYVSFFTLFSALYDLLVNV